MRTNDLVRHELDAADRLDPALALANPAAMFQTLMAARRSQEPSRQKEPDRTLNPVPFVPLQQTEF